MPGRHVWLLPGYAWGVGAFGVLLCLEMWRRQSPLSQLMAEPGPLLLLIVCLVLGELFPISIARGDATTAKITISTTFAVALVIVGPLALVLLAHLVAVSLDDIRSGRRPVQIVFNVGQYSLSLVAARLAFCAVSGVPFLADHRTFSSSHLSAALLAGAVFVLVNHLLVGVVVSLSTATSIRRSLGQDLRFTLETSAVLVGMAPLTLLVIDVALWMLPLVLLPILAVRRSAKMAAVSERQALRDPLTGLGNRASLQWKLIREQTEGDHRRGVAMLLVDLDDFKDINDNLGHDVGDLVLVEVSSRLQRVAPRGAHVVRLGGDEFALLIGAASPGPGDALAVAERAAQDILDAFAQPVLVGGTRLALQGSVGVAVARDSQGIQQLLKHADIALYEAKAERACFAVYRPRSGDVAMDRLAVLAHLSDAVRAGQLDVAYQPQYDCRTGAITAVEALVRWPDSRFTGVPTGVLVSLAENAGLIQAVSDQVLEVALADVARWRRQGHDVSLAVNISARQLSDAALPERIRAALARHGVPPTALVVEVTESSLMVDAKRADTILESLRSLGVLLSIDDFGTGYSSLVRLKEIAVDELKIDREFVADMTSGRTNDSLVRAIIDLAKNLGLQVVAEGVENEWAAATLSLMGCDRLQGYHLARPMSAAAAEQLLEDTSLRAARTPTWTATVLAPRQPMAGQTPVPSPAVVVPPVVVPVSS